MDFEDDLAESCENSLRDLEEGSVVFQGKGQIKLLRTVDDESVNVKGLMGKGAFANVKAATIDEFPARRNSSFTKYMRAFGRNSIRSSGKKYAIKSLRTSLRSSLVFDGVIDLAKEAMFLDVLRHPNIIYLHGAAKNPGRSDYFLVIEPLQTTLIDRFGKWWDGGKHAPAIFQSKAKKDKSNELMHARMASILGIASALEYLHEKNILYRDLKPGNIGFDKYDVVKLFDFGLATELKEINKVGDDQYNATECTGTPRYMPGEVYFGQPYGLPADVFSFALILYEVVALDKAFSNSTTLKDHVEKVYEKKKRPKLDKTMPKEIKNWITTGWSHDPSSRPKMSSLCREMTEYLASKGHSGSEESLAT